MYVVNFCQDSILQVNIVNIKEHVGISSVKKYILIFSTNIYFKVFLTAYKIFIMFESYS